MSLQGEFVFDVVNGQQSTVQVVGVYGAGGKNAGENPTLKTLVTSMK